MCGPPRAAGAEATLPAFVWMRLCCRRRELEPALESPYVELPQPRERLALERSRGPALRPLGGPGKVWVDPIHCVLCRHWGWTLTLGLRPAASLHRIGSMLISSHPPPLGCALQAGPHGAQSPPPPAGAGCGAGGAVGHRTGQH